MRTVVKALRILAELSTSTNALSAATLAQRLEIPRPTVYRYLDTLADEGLVALLDGKAIVTPKLAAILTTPRNHLTLMQVVQPVLNELVDVSQETASAHIRSGSVRRCVAEVEGTRGVRWARGVGFAAPIWSGAVGHVMMGTLSEAEMDAILASSNIQAYASMSITDPSELKRLALLANSKGWSGSVNETVEDACAIAAPVLSPQHDLLLVVSLYAPSSRYDELLTNVRTVRNAAGRVETEWARVGKHSTEVYS